MSNTIDTLSQMLGEMKSNIMHIREKTDVINDKLENVQKSTIKQGMQIDSAHARLDRFEEVQEEIKKTHKQIKKKVESHETFKVRAKVWIGIIASIWTVLVGIGVSIVKSIVPALF